MIEIKDITYTYSKGSTLTFPDLNLDNHAVILGPSGVGKTTLLHLLAGILTPSQGEIRINHTTTSKLSRKQLDRFRGEHIGLIFQHPHVIRSLTVKQNLEIIQKVGRNQMDLPLIDSILGKLGLSDYQNKLATRLSQGQKQRVSIAMALVNKPAIILADEPTSSLDDAHCEQVMELLLQQADEVNAQLITITHDHRIKGHFQNQISL